MTINTHAYWDMFTRAVVPIKTNRAVTVGILGFLTFIGVVAGLGRLLMGLSATTALTDSYPWGIWIGFDFTLIAFAGTGFTMAAVVHVFHLEKYAPAMRPAIFAGLMGYSAVLLLLVLDLGRPDRFYHFIIFWNMHSPLFEISWCVLLYSTVLVIEVSPCLFQKLNMERPVQIAQKIMGPVTIIGVTLSSLHQSTLGTLYLNMPHRLDQLWYTPILPLMFFVSSIMAGLALAILAYKVSIRLQNKTQDLDLIRGLCRLLFWAMVVYTALKIGELIIGGDMPTLLLMNKMSLLWSAELTIGAIIPIILWLIPGIRRHWFMQWVGPLLVLFGVMFNRFNATMFGQQLTNASGVTYDPHILEWLSTIGIVAGAMLVWYLGTRFLVIFAPETECGGKQH